MQNATTFKACPASAHFQLAIVQAAQRSIDNAILSARQALELAPKERRAWHLLALLLTAKEEWSNAKQLIDICLLETAEEDRDPASPPIIVNQDGLGAQENASLGLEGDGDPGALISEPMRTLIEPRSDQIPYPYTLLAGMSIAPPTSRHERFEASISLLLTQIAIIEKLEGADNANERLQELFTYFSSHSPSGTVPSSRSKLELTYSVLMVIQLSFRGITGCVAVRRIRTIPYHHRERSADRSQRARDSDSGVFGSKIYRVRLSLSSLLASATSEEEE